jgi:hypothetical protein
VSELRHQPHEWDDDAVCIHCGFDGAEDSHLRNSLRLQIGDDEYRYRKQQGEFDAGRYCTARPLIRVPLADSGGKE